jgi:hypothetical protein
MLRKSMETDLRDKGTPKWMTWTGYVLTALPVALLIFSTAAKLIKPPQVVEAFARFGIEEWLIFRIGIVELICTVLYLIPRTAILGAMLLTAYLGGATVTHLRIGDPFITPILVGILLWGGLYLREPRLRELVPLRKKLG